MLFYEKTEVESIWSKLCIVLYIYMYVIQLCIIVLNWIKEGKTLKLIFFLSSTLLLWSLLFKFYGAPNQPVILNMYLPERHQFQFFGKSVSIWIYTWDSNLFQPSPCWFQNILDFRNITQIHLCYHNCIPTVYGCLCSYICHQQGSMWWETWSHLYFLTFHITCSTLNPLLLNFIVYVWLELFHDWGIH